MPTFARAALLSTLGVVIACNADSGGAADLAVPHADLVAGGDLAAPDLAMADLAIPDLVAAPDLTIADLAVAPGAVVAEASGAMLFQNCQPLVPPDPARLSLSVRFTNKGGGDVGPIAVTSGEVNDQGGNRLATFDFVKQSTGVLRPGGSQTLALTKANDTLAPANGCKTLPCGTTVDIVVPFAGPGVPGKSTAVAGKVSVDCAF